MKALDALLTVFLQELILMLNSFSPKWTGENLVQKALLAALQYEKVDGTCEISVTFVSDRIIRQLNRDYRGIDRSTDVLSFPQAEDGNLDDAFDGERYQLGDVVLSLEHARAQAELYGHNLQREIGFLTVHSMFHLLGYDHEAGGLEMVRMREKEETVLTQLGLKRNDSYYTEDN